MGGYRRSLKFSTGQCVPTTCCIYLLNTTCMCVTPLGTKKSTLVTPLGTNSDVSCDPFRYRKTPQNHRATVQKSPHPSLFFGEINGLDGARINAPLAVE